MKDISPVKITFACFVFLASLFLSGDVMVAVYSLFVTGLVMYFFRENKSLWSGDNLLKTGGVVLFASLIYPLIGIQLAFVAGFLGILWVHKKILDGRFSFGAAIFFLILCPVLLALKQDKFAEGSAIFAFYFLTAGTFQEIIALMVNPREDEETEPFEIKPIHVKKGKFEQLVVN